MKPLLVYIPIRNGTDAKKLAEHLLLQRLISCANIIPKMISMYWQDEDMKTENETLLLVKTFEKKHKQLLQEIKEQHPHENPAITTIDIGANKEYLAWSQKNIFT